MGSGWMSCQWDFPPEHPYPSQTEHPHPVRSTNIHIYQQLSAAFSVLYISNLLTAYILFGEYNGNEKQCVLAVERTIPAAMMGV